jgi:hypothetical protein
VQTTRLTGGFDFEAQQGLAFPPNKGIARSNGRSKYFGCAEIARPTKKPLRDPFDYARFAALRSG